MFDQLLSVLVRSRAGSRGRQARLTYEITAAGRRTLVTWLSDHVGDEAIEAPPDPLRTRLYYLGVLPAGWRRRWG